MRQQLFEFRDGFRERAEDGVGAAQLPARIALVGRAAEPLLQLRDAAVVEAGVVVGDLEVALGDLHAGIELEGARELLDRLGHQTLLIVEHAEIVVRAGVRRIDPARKRTQDREVAFGNGSRRGVRERRGGGRRLRRRHRSTQPDGVEDRFE